MPKVKYNDIVFDSELEIEYYKYLMDQIDVVDFYYHPKYSIMINSKNKYTPDFIVIYNDRIEIVETKGFNQFSYMRDNMIHNVMLEKTENELKQYLYDNNIAEEQINNKKVIYRKVKFLKAYGFVDFDFKSPNTIANKRKAKINELEEELKELRNYKKDVERYFSYLRKDKLTKQQLIWKKDFELRNDLL